jgi:hypothetical protein
MAEKSFTEKQREIVARKMGFEGPMDMFDSYLKSSPADARKYGLITETFLAKGGMVKKNKKVRKFVDGGAVTTSSSSPSAESIARQQAIATMYGQELGRAADTEGLNFWANSGLSLEEIRRNIQGSQEGIAALSKTAAQEAATARVRAAAPQQPGAASVSAAQIGASADQFINTRLAPEKASTVTAAPAAETATAAMPTVTPAETVTAAQGAGAVAGALSGVTAAQGTVTPEATVQAAQVVPTDTAVAGLQAAQGTATQIGAAPIRTVGAGELVAGTTVDQARIDAELAKNVAIQGEVTAEMTVQGQLDKLLADFEAKNPPPWAAASMRQANAVLSARGIGASSLAGQAIIQATLEAATPIAAADAQTTFQMGIQNLSNRQQMAVLSAQQRAQFLGQEFDQAFQTRVVNAAKVSDAANQTFGAQVQITLENARLAQTMDLANLSNSQAMIMATAAQISNLETANLNNRQQAAVVNAQSFLQMDLANLANTQQTELFKAQATVQSILTDTAADNAARQFNASSINQTNQFFASLTAQVGQFNASQTNAMSQFNIDQANSVSKFNAEAQNLRDQFNAQNRLVIDQSNAQWRRDIATANTAATNRANEFNATKAQEITMVEYNNQWQQFRDEIEYSWRSAESAAERVNKVTITEIQSNANILVATMAQDAKLTESIAANAAKILGGTDAAGAASGIFKTLVSAGNAAYTGVTGAWDSLYTWATGGADQIESLWNDTWSDIEVE